MLFRSKLCTQLPLPSKKSLVLPRQGTSLTSSGAESISLTGSKADLVFCLQAVQCLYAADKKSLAASKNAWQDSVKNVWLKPNQQLLISMGTLARIHLVAWWSTLMNSQIFLHPVLWPTKTNCPTQSHSLQHKWPPSRMQFVCLF